MTDNCISRIICERLNLRAYTLTSLGAVRTVTAIHETTPNATVALGRTLNAAALLSATLKPGSNQNISLVFSGNGPAKEIIAQADALGNIRACMSDPRIDTVADIGEISFSKIIGEGFLTVTKDLGIKDSYRSVIPLGTGEVAADVAYYLTSSEQIPSAMILGLTIDRGGQAASSGGILIQTFPNTEETVIDMIEESIRDMANPLGDELREGKDIHSVLSNIFRDEPLTVIDSYPIQVSCRCGKDLLYRILTTIAEGDLVSMIREDNGAEITCSFCRRKYRFTGQELEDILRKKKAH